MGRVDIDLDTLQRAGGGDHVSDLSLDQLVAGELGKVEAHALRAHLSDCSGCGERLAAREQGFGQFGGEVDGGALFERVMSEVDLSSVPESVSAAVREVAAQPSPEPASPTLWSRVAAALNFKVLGAIAVGAAAALLLMPRAGVPVVDPTDPGVRTKGSVALRVMRARGENVAEAFSSDTFQAGDRLRFIVDAPEGEGGYAMVVGREASGTTYAAWPLDNGDASVELTAGKGVELDGAVALDDAPGDEWLALVVCSEPFGLSAVTFVGQPPIVGTATGCKTATFHVAKAKAETDTRGGPAE